MIWSWTCASRSTFSTRVARFTVSSMSRCCANGWRIWPSCHSTSGITFVWILNCTIRLTRNGRGIVAQAYARIDPQRRSLCQCKGPSESKSGCYWEIRRQGSAVFAATITWSFCLTRLWSNWHRVKAVGPQLWHLTRIRSELSVNLLWASEKFQNSHDAVHDGNERVLSLRQTRCQAWSCDVHDAKDFTSPCLFEPTQHFWKKI